MSWDVKLERIHHKNIWTASQIAKGTVNAKALRWETSLVCLRKKKGHAGQGRVSDGITASPHNVKLMAQAGGVNRDGRCGVEGGGHYILCELKDKGQLTGQVGGHSAYREQHVQSQGG